MKKIIASASLFAVGAATVQAANTTGLSPQETAKPWSVSASLMGFYDDNYSTLHDDADPQSSWGFLFRPVASLNAVHDQTLLKAEVDYRLSYYFDRPENELDHTLQLLAKVDHRISERYRFSIGDSFVYSSEPEILQAGTPFRADQSAIRNVVSADFTAQITEVLALQPAGDFQYYDYFDDGPGSYSALLDRMAYLGRLDALYQAREDILAIAGYQFGYADYTSKDLLVNVPGSLQGKDRDYLTHTFYVGARYDFTTQLNVLGKIGAQYFDFQTLEGDGWSPYADIQATYTYLPGSYAQLGVRMGTYATDLSASSQANANNTTGNQDLLATYAAVNHQITPKITGSIMGQYQYSQFNGGIYDDNSENFFLLGVSLEYKIDRFWSVSAAYNWDHLDSCLDPSDGSTPPARSYSRNRVFLGVTAKF